MKKRIAVIGKGTAGAQSVIHYLRHMDNCEVHWYFDEKIPTQAVGEGSTLTLPRNLFENINLNYLNLDKIDATLKTGIYKSGWGKSGKEFLHSFPAPAVGLHFNAISLQNYIFEEVKDLVTIHNESINSFDVDADYIMDCSGKPESYEDYNQAQYIPVNSAYVTQCYWDYPRFNYSLTIARPYGWVFGIPLQNRCSIGYLFNSSINSIEDIKTDILEVFSEYNLIPSDNTNHLEFKNYYRKQNFTDRVVYNGNKSFFLEPLEATSIALMNEIQRDAFDLWNNNASIEELNESYTRNVLEIQTVILLHYFSGSIYNTAFWKYAQDLGEQCISNAIKKDSRFVDFIQYSLDKKYAYFCQGHPEYGSWWAGAFCQNLAGLGIDGILKKKLLDIVDD